MLKHTYIFILFLIAINFSAAQWSSSSYEDRFDGEIRIAKNIGQSNDVNYKNPILVLRKNNNLEFFLSNISYLVGDLNVKIAFDDDNQIFESVRTSKSTDSQGLFFNEFKSEKETFSLIEFLDIIISHKQMYIRVSDRTDRFDVEFILDNAKQSFLDVEINFNNLLDKAKKTKEAIRLKRIAEKDEFNKKRKYLNDIRAKLIDIAEKTGLTDESMSNFRAVLREEELRYNSLSTMDIDSVFFDPIMKRNSNEIMTVQGSFVSKKYKLKDAGIYIISNESDFYKKGMLVIKQKEQLLNEQIKKLKNQTFKIIGDSLLTNSLINNIVNTKKTNAVKDFDSISIFVEGKRSVVPTFYFKKNGELIEKIDVFKKLPSEIITKLKRE